MKLPINMETYGNTDECGKQKNSLPLIVYVTTWRNAGIWVDNLFGVGKMDGIGVDLQLAGGMMPYTQSVHPWGNFSFLELRHYSVESWPFREELTGLKLWHCLNILTVRSSSYVPTNDQLLLHEQHYDVMIPNGSLPGKRTGQKCFCLETTLPVDQ